tara:strand:+ start:117 stop:248 length:132 start_codon:yes stop_codon:yes gene_type:complete
MIRIITLAILLCCLIISCGKKGDPEYKDPEKKAKVHNIIIKVI